MSFPPKPRLQFADWLAAERASDQGRTEFLDGEVFAMAGGSETHNLICGNVLRKLGTRFKDRPCYVYTSDMKVRIESANLGTYPDVMAVCGERLFWVGSGSRKPISKAASLAIGRSVRKCPSKTMNQ